MVFKNGHIVRLLEERTIAISKNDELGLSEIERDLRIACERSQKELLTPFKVFITFEKEEGYLMMKKEAKLIFCSGLSA